ncbi:PREDICTED: probable xyloglucan endotransglucosylase/hydrolase protein 8 [Lupinus angustifolius]|uniref:probable xyloglucan endotransglucosylase/hydrolase protein 8 n=1 Tax=Lupinus angustifolius TaxID=3871 RepID=UPI00092E55C3|nr:PREDICTED: probable xyloglucan endotransglucosylase/hydrolase protein 8 [Lupinus angustifolius]
MWPAFPFPSFPSKIQFPNKHLAAFSFHSYEAAVSKGSYDDSFTIMWSEDHFTTSKDGQIWYLSFDNDTGCGFQTKQRYRFGWFSMKLKLVGGDSAGVVTAYYMCSEKGAGPERDELDFEFLGNRTGEPYLIQTYIYTNGTGNHEMRHQLWFDPTEDYHTYSIIWNTHQIVFFVDRVPIRVFKNNGNSIHKNILTGFL